MKKIIFTVIICSFIFSFVGAYAGSGLSASDLSVTVPTESNLEAGSTLQDSLDELYSMANSNDKTEILTNKISNLETNLNETKPVVTEAKNLASNAATKTELSNLTNTVNAKKTTQAHWYFNKGTSIISDSEVTLSQVNLTPGSYMIYFSQSFSSNKTGMRYLKLNIVNDAWGTTTKIGANQSGETTVNMTAPLILGSNTTLYFVAKQNSGSTLTGNTICQVIKLS